METRWLTTTEVAEAMHVRRQTVTRWIRGGKLRARRMKVGQRAIYWVDRRELIDFARRYVQDL